MRSAVKILVPILLLFSACDSWSPKGEDTLCDTAKARRYNDAAMDIKMAYYYHHTITHEQKEDSLNSAIMLLDIAINTCPNIALYYTNQANLYLDLGKKEEALDVIKKMNSILPMSEDPLFTGMLYYVNGDSVKSYKMFEKGLGLIKQAQDTMDKDSELYDVALYSEGFVLTLMRKYDEAQEHVKVMDNIEDKINLQEFIDSSRANPDYYFQDWFSDISDN
ncbi:MAG: hypothetical protein H6551_06810 [Chitinophagales bacterium]|nr:hypothetical protein [Chitinophagaceae bacterium]MCB9064841.1 hypothetical protein [Chitinophagales bacterium]